MYSWKATKFRKANLHSIKTTKVWERLGTHGGVRVATSAVIVRPRRTSSVIRFLPAKLGNSRCDIVAEVMTFGDCDAAATCIAGLCCAGNFSCQSLGASSSYRRASGASARRRRAADGRRSAYECRNGPIGVCGGANRRIQSSAGRSHPRDL